MLSIGCDIEDNSRFEGKSDEFLKRIFTDEEIFYCKKNKNSSSHFCARFCAKEAVIKALSALGENKISYSKIEILKDNSGAPFIKIHDKIFEKYRFLLTISHEKEKSVAFVAVL